MVDYTIDEPPWLAACMADRELQCKSPTCNTPLQDLVKKSHWLKYEHPNEWRTRGHAIVRELMKANARTAPRGHLAANPLRPFLLICSRCETPVCSTCLEERAVAKDGGSMCPCCERDVCLSKGYTKKTRKYFPQQTRMEIWTLLLIRCRLRQTQRFSGMGVLPSEFWTDYFSKFLV